ncbi:YIL096C [Zygosaccharomyces parabailii]|uniref:ZYBA0S04-06436g1_1 n=1 Tax=Zygosaccharomyces bailii (strain CLIB 213 / ATCC 58445 / CBS 680 / BCRC 21525 / NBRC 1098 / NCYC 1416 / NRRL Y-2227) TaxID=1333698 RepID=A0A8J2T5H7_ZYGB2|nr:YIL096C [Zygosaccharomyces parabailii]CDF89527.1 ZYBA0S04-06436g1_1 [Zygosaccharomyces bailii CLIB 213]CDH08495.1 related to UPF0617 protein YIL096C [Zygosaccharomyces bailii ISA1307]SJM88400.1 related to UPF0617 protein YIL096C [Zygosaccharomyces bailii]
MAKHSKGKGLRASLKIYQAAERLRALEKKKEKNTIRKGQRGKSVKRNQESQRRNNVPFVPFHRNSTLLLVGEGDFSFARSVIEQNYVLAENLIVTSYDDSIEELNAKYPNSFQENYQFLISEGVAVFVGIDATNLIKTFKLSKKNTWNKLLGHDWSNKCLENIMFNFPHTGKGIKDQARNIRDHQTLVDEFFRSCKELFQNVNSKVISNKSHYIRGYNDESQNSVSSEGFGTILLTIFAGEPYDSWRIKTLAKGNGLQLERSNRFQWEIYPSYHHRRTNSEQETTKPAKEREARMYVFKKSEIGEEEKKTSKDRDEEKL